MFRPKKHVKVLRNYISQWLQVRTRIKDGNLIVIDVLKRDEGAVFLIIYRKLQEEERISV